MNLDDMDLGVKKVELVPLDKEKVKKSVDKIRVVIGGVMWGIPSEALDGITNEICSTFGTKQVSVKEIRDVIESNTEWDDDRGYGITFFSTASQAIHALIYCKENK